MKDVCFALICFLCFIGAECDADCKEKKNIKIGENVTLRVENDASEQIEDILWAKSSNTFFQISENGPGDFLNGSYKSIICHYNISSITICNATRNNMGIYIAQIKYRDRKYPSKIFYVEEYNAFCGGTTDVNGTEGQAVTLPVEGSTNEREIWWSNDKMIDIDSENAKFHKADNGSLVIKRLTKEDEGSYAVKMEAECDHNYVLKVASPDVRSSIGPLKGIRTGGIVVGIILLVLVIIVIYVCYKYKDKLKCCKAIEGVL